MKDFQILCFWFWKDKIPIWALSAHGGQLPRGGLEARAIWGPTKYPWFNHNYVMCVQNFFPMNFLGEKLGVSLPPLDGPDSGFTKNAGNLFSWLLMDTFGGTRWS